MNPYIRHPRFVRHCPNPECFSLDCRDYDTCHAKEETEVISSRRTLKKFADELPIPSVLQPVRKSRSHTYYEVTMKQCRQQLHSELPETDLWGYEGIYPGPIIEVEAGEHVQIKWCNELPKRHLFPIDYTVHGAQRNVPDVRTVVHIHGANVESESDGYPEAWFTAGFQQVGPYFKKEVYRYDNDQRACMLWYHDHALGITRLNVYAGLAGLYIIRDEEERALKLPSGPYEIPLVIQDKTVQEDGVLYYPSQPEKPLKALRVSVVPEFFGEVNVVNGKIWPHLNVSPRKYRFRIVNAANSRFYRLRLDSGQFFYQIGTDGGMMKKPILVSEITLAPGERADIIIDFSGLQGKRIGMTNDAPAPFPGGEMPDPHTDGAVMEFRVSLSLEDRDTSHIPDSLSVIPVNSAQVAERERHLTLDSQIDRYGRKVMLLDHKVWDDPVTEIIDAGSVEMWHFINLTNDSYPMHIHLNDFQIVDHRPFDVERFKKEGIIHYTGPRRMPERQEEGWKDTVRVNPKEVTRLIKRFGPYTGLYVWHCHMLEHEDYEMMRPFVIVDKIE